MSEKGVNTLMVMNRRSINGRVQKERMSSRKGRSASRLLIQIGRKIRDRRKVRGLTQESLAEEADLHRVYVGEIERGETNVTVGVLQRIATVLGVRVVDLFPYRLPQKPATQREALIDELLNTTLLQPPKTQRVVLATFHILLKELKLGSD